MRTIKEFEKKVGIAHFKVIKEAFEQVEQEPDMEKFKQMKEILNKIFGPDNNQIVKPDFESFCLRYEPELVVNSSLSRDPSQLFASFKNFIIREYSFNIIIRFPELKITNSRNQAHTIRDLYVMIPMKPNGLLTKQMKGIRATLSQAEAEVGYMHSHLPIQYLPDIEWCSFCLGTGEISQPMALLRTEYSDVNFTLLCLHLQNYVVWESIEGTPYITMNNVFSRGRGDIENYCAIEILEKASEFIVGEIKKQLTVEELMNMLTFNVSPRGVSIEPTVEFERWIAGTLIAIDAHKLRSLHRNINGVDLLLALKDTASGKYYTIGTSRTVEEGNATLFKFKDKEIKLKILKNEEEIKNEKYPNPKITSSVCAKLSRSVTKCALSYEETTDIKTA